MEENTKETNEKMILKQIYSFLRNIDYRYTDEHNKDVSITIKNLSETYKNLRESE